MAKKGMKRAPAKRRPRKAQAKSRGLTPQECRLEGLSRADRDVTDRIDHEGGMILGCYNDPLGKNPVVVAILPIDSIEPTPFQRDLSQMHHRKLADVLNRTGMFLDPVIAVTAPDKGFWTPNGRHRLEAMRRLGARSITALVVPKREIAWQILALNTEKAHNLRERSLEVIRIYKGLIETLAEDDRRTSFAIHLDPPGFWVDDVSPPTLRLRTKRVSGGRSVLVSAIDKGAGVYPQSIRVTVDGSRARWTLRGGLISIPTRGLAAGSHRLRLRVSDFQESKNTENVARILPNTRWMTAQFTVR